MLLLVGCKVDHEDIHDSQVCLILNRYSSQVYDGVVSGINSCGKFSASAAEEIGNFASFFWRTLGIGAETLAGLGQAVGGLFLEGIYFTADSSADAVSSLAENTGGLFRRGKGGDLPEDPPTETETSSRWSHYISELVFSLSFGFYEMSVGVFGLFLTVLSSFWAAIWSLVVNISFLIASIGQKLEPSQPVADLDAVGVTQLDQDQLVSSILQNPQFRDYVTKTANEHMSVERANLESHLEKILTFE